MFRDERTQVKTKSTPLDPILGTLGSEAAGPKQEGYSITSLGNFLTAMCHHAADEGKQLWSKAVRTTVHAAADQNLRNKVAFTAKSYRCRSTAASV